MNVLGIETSCDETAAAVVKDGREILSNIVASQIEEHKKYGGVVPEIASRMHSEVISSVTRKSITDSGLSLSDIDAIAVTNSPGLIGALLVGVNFAKGLALATGKPLIPVGHLRGHIAANYITSKDLQPPFLCLVASGGHSHIIEVTDYTSFRVIGKTRDDAAGEAFDKAARSMGMPYPGGVHLDKIAETGNDTAFKLPKPKIEDAPLDFSFSGLKTAVVNMIHNANQKGEAVNTADLSASYRKAVVDLLLEHFIAAAKQTGTKKLVVAGGVSANSLLRSRLENLKQDGYEVYIPELSLCGDNAAMIASQGYYELLAGNTADMALNAYARSH